MKEREKFTLKNWQRRRKKGNRAYLIRRQKHKSKRALVTTTLNLISDLNYSFECDWLIELSYNKLFNNNLASD